MGINLRTFNLNDFIYVELTDYGWKKLNSYFHNYLDDEGAEHFIDNFKANTMLYETPNGKKSLTEIQMHQFMYIFGDVSVPGCDPFVVNSEIYFKEDIK